MTDLSNDLASMVLHLATQLAAQDGRAPGPVHVFAASNEIVLQVGRVRDRLMGPPATIIAVGDAVRTGVEEFPDGVVSDIHGDFAVVRREGPDGTIHSAFPVRGLQKVALVETPEPEAPAETPPPEEPAPETPAPAAEPPAPAANEGGDPAPAADPETPAAPDAGAGS